MKLKRRVLLLLSAYDPQTHQAAVEAARTFDWHLDTNLLTPQRMLSDWRGDGILCSLTNNASHLNFVQESGLPAVDLSTWRTDIKIPRVSADNRALGKLAGEHFIQFAHDNYAWYSSEATPFGDERLTSFEETVAAHGHRVLRIDSSGRQNYSTIQRRIQKLPRPCAIFCMNDSDAAWIASICLEQGYNIPMDFAILGIDNNPLICDVHSVPLSSIDKNAKKITYEASLCLQRAMDGETVPDTTRFISHEGVTQRASSNHFAHKDETIRAALQYLQDNLSQKIGTPEVAQILGISQSGLNKRFQDVLNKSLHQTLISMRLKAASVQLKKTSDSLEVIAASNGFTHASHLSNCFKKHYGMSPNTYRKQSD
ncbi:MAG: substrate-binding domain-containing protein [Opitutales bacterium]